MPAVALTAAVKLSRIRHTPPQWRQAHLYEPRETLAVQVQPASTSWHAPLLPLTMHLQPRALFTSALKLLATPAFNQVHKGLDSAQEVLPHRHSQLAALKQLHHAT